MTTGRDLLADHLKTDLWHVLESPPDWAKIKFVMASKSSRWADAAVVPHLNKVMSAGTVDAVTLEGGHWIHVDNAHAVTDLLAKTLGR